MNIRTDGLKQRADGSRYMVGMVEGGRLIETRLIEIPREEGHDLTKEIEFIKTGRV